MIASGSEFRSVGGTMIEIRWRLSWRNGDWNWIKIQDHLEEQWLKLDSTSWR